MKLIMATATMLVMFAQWNTDGDNRAFRGNSVQDKGFQVSAPSEFNAVYIVPPAVPAVISSIEIHMLCFDDATQLWNRCRKEQTNMKASEEIMLPGIDNIIVFVGKGKLTREGKVVLEPGTTQDEFLRAAFMAIINSNAEQSLSCSDEKRTMRAQMNKCMKGWKDFIDRTQQIIDGHEKTKKEKR